MDPKLNNDFANMDISPSRRPSSNNSSTTQGHTSSDSDNIQSPHNSIASTIIDSPDNSIASTIIDSPDNYNDEFINDLYEQISSLKNENNILNNRIKTYEINYKDVPIPATEKLDRHGNSLYTLCPLTTAHDDDVLIFTEDGKPFKGTRLFPDFNEDNNKSKSPPTKKRKRSRSKSKGGKKSRKNRV